MIGTSTCRDRTTLLLLAALSLSAQDADGYERIETNYLNALGRLSERG